MTLRLAVTPGEPAGIGPDLILQLLQKPWPFEIVVFADKNVLFERAKLLGIPLSLSGFERTFNVVHIAARQPVIPGELNKENSAYVLETIKQATKACMQGECAALVTGPVHKAIIHRAGFSFTGHTEFLAAITQAPLPVMMLVARDFRVALITTHLPLRKVANAINQPLIEQVISIIYRDLKKFFGLSQPKIFVAGLNPHAGEQGMLGDEEIKMIAPAIKNLVNQGIKVVGPLPADTLFTEQYRSQADVFVAMYHDQGLAVIKALDFSHSVNVTLGLPIIRTSVDHGTALELAGTRQADETSFTEALMLAYQMVSMNTSRK